MRKLGEILQKVQLIDGAALTAIMEEVNVEQRQHLAEFRGSQVDAHDEEGELASQMTDKEWLHYYRKMDDAKIQTWIDLFVDQSDDEMNLPTTVKEAIMERGGERLWRVLKDAVSDPSDLSDLSEAAYYNAVRNMS